MLTGGIATGKSYVLARFAGHGVPTIDADALAHAAMAPEGDAWPALRVELGEEMFEHDGTIDRRRLGERVFADDQTRATLNAIVHPHVRLAITRWFDALEDQPDHRFGLVAIPLFFETPRSEAYDRVITTACQHQVQRDRVVARGFSLEEAERRIAAQLPTAEKTRRADHVIWTDGAYADTDTRADAIYREFRDASTATGAQG